MGRRLLDRGGVDLNAAQPFVAPRSGSEDTPRSILGVISRDSQGAVEVLNIKKCNHSPAMRMMAVLVLLSFLVPWP